MAGDWIKMRVNLRKHPKVIAMSRYLAADRSFMDWWSDPQHTNCHEDVTEVVTFENVTRVTVCGLMEVWGAINSAIRDDDTVEYMELIDIDDIAGIPGFGDAMASVGWVSVVEGGDCKGLIFPNFREFNTPDAERKRAKTDAERAREYRQRRKAEADNSERHDRHETSRGEEKRREENRGEGASDEAPAKEARAHQLPADFELPDEWRQWAVENTPGVDPDAEAAKFRDYWHAQPGQKARKKDWFATWRNWCRKAQEWGGGKAANEEPVNPARKRLTAEDFK